MAEMLIGRHAQSAIGTYEDRWPARNIPFLEGLRVMATTAVS